jgi:hypothetical protein
MGGLPTEWCEEALRLSPVAGVGILQLVIGWFDILLGIH